MNKKHQSISLKEKPLHYEERIPSGLYYEFKKAKLEFIERIRSLQD